jgi:potassium/hydrogen antiporter
MEVRGLHSIRWWLGMTVELIMAMVALLLLIGVLASKASDRLGVPALLLLLAVGMVAGTEGLGGIPFDDKQATQALGVVALAFILFAGGLDTAWRQVKGVMWRGVSLSTLGVVLTAGVTGALAAPLLGLGWREGLLLGSIMSSTDAAAVFSVLRSKGVSLKGSTKPLLELESGSNDPMAVFLTMASLQLVQQPDGPLFDLLWLFVQQMALGSAGGYILGFGAVQVINRVKLETEGLYPVLTLALVLLIFGATASVNGNGFLAVYIAGIVVGNSDFIHKRSLVRFHDGLAWLMQVTMFVALGLLVFPSHLGPVAWKGLLIALILMLIARPLGVFASLLFAKMATRQKALISWVGLRGAVPIVLATFPAVAGLPDAELYFNVVFFVVLASVLIQGTTISLAARYLGLEAPAARKREYPLEYVSRGTSRNDLVEIEISADSPVTGKQVVELRLPGNALIVLLSRGDDFVVPRGATRLQAGDVILLLADPQSAERVRQLVGGPRVATVEEEED